MILLLRVAGVTVALLQPLRSWGRASRASIEEEPYQKVAIEAAVEVLTQIVHQDQLRIVRR